MKSQLRARDGPIRTARILRSAVENVPQPHIDVHPWRVLHLSDLTGPLGALVSGQLELGMRPEVLTRQGSIRFNELSVAAFRRKQFNTPTSLLDLWRHTRIWDRLLRNADRGRESEIVHTYSLAAALAAVRREAPVVVYEIDRFAAEARETQSRSHPWLSRALQSAEQFALHRVVAVCHQQSAREKIIRRAIEVDDVFVIPEASYVSTPPQPRYEFLRSHGIEPRRDVVLYAPAWKLDVDRRGELTTNSRTLLEILTVVAAEANEVQFLIEFAPNALASIQEWSIALGVDSRIHLVNEDNLRAAEISADIILAGDVPFGNPGCTLNPFAVRALQHRKALLAADVTCNRDLTPDGRGCLWYAHQSPRDLARRAAFLVRNPDFRQSLALAGHNYFQDSRDPVKVAAKYDAVYRRAFSRTARGRTAPPFASLAPVRMVV